MNFYKKAAEVFYEGRRDSARTIRMRPTPDQQARIDLASKKAKADRKPEEPVLFGKKKSTSYDSGGSGWGDAARKAAQKSRGAKTTEVSDDEEEDKTGKAVEMAEPGEVINSSKKTKKKAKKEEGNDWIQKAVNPKHKGYCTPMTKETCTPARKALAKRFKKAGRKEKKSGGTGWQGKV